MDFGAHFTFKGSTLTDHDHINQQGGTTDETNST
jgi:hypothetical protein